MVLNHDGKVAKNAVFKCICVIIVDINLVRIKMNIKIINKQDRYWKAISAVLVVFLAFIILMNTAVSAEITGGFSSLKLIGSSITGDNWTIQGSQGSQGLITIQAQNPNSGQGGSTNNTAFDLVFKTLLAMALIAAFIGIVFITHADWRAIAIAAFVIIMIWAFCQAAL